MPSNKAPGPRHSFVAQHGFMSRTGQPGDRATEGSSSKYRSGILRGQDRKQLQVRLIDSTVEGRSLIPSLGPNRTTREPKRPPQRACYLPGPVNHCLHSGYKTGTVVSGNGFRATNALATNHAQSTQWPDRSCQRRLQNGSSCLFSFGKFHFTFRLVLRSMITHISAPHVN